MLKCPVRIGLEFSKYIFITVTIFDHNHHNIMYVLDAVVKTIGQKYFDQKVQDIRVTRFNRKIYYK